MATRKKKAPETTATTVPTKTAIKVLRDGKSWHVRSGEPTVTVRALASALDYRLACPVHHLAAEGQVLTIATDGSVTQKSEKE